MKGGRVLRQMAHSTVVFLSSILLFSIYPENIMKIKDILKKILVYLEEDNLHSSKDLFQE